MDNTKAATYRVTITTGITGRASFYTYLTGTPAEAVDQAKAEHTTDYGFLNVGQKVEQVQVWNIETKAWDDVVETEAPKALDAMTYEEKNNELCDMWSATNNGSLPYFGFNGGGPASVKSKNYLRALLAKHAGRREAELIRWSLNDVRESGETVTKSDVLPAITILKAL